MAARVSFVIDVDDKESMGSIGRMLQLMAQVEAAETEIQPMLPGIGTEYKSARQELEKCCGAHHAPVLVAGTLTPFTSTDAPADTATIFGGGAPTPPEPVQYEYVPGADGSTPVPPQPAPPVAVVPAPPAPAAPTAGVELDKNGMPWDARINTSNKAKTEKGVWKMKKGMPEGYYDQVIAELKQTMGAPAAPVAPAAPAPVVEENRAPNYSGAQSGGYTPPPVAPAAPAAPVAPAPPAATTGDVPDTFPKLMMAVSPMIQANKITSDEVNAVCVGLGLPTVTAAAARADLIPSIYAGCVAIWSAR